MNIQLVAPFAGSFFSLEAFQAEAGLKDKQNFNSL